MNVKELMTNAPRTCSVTDSAADAARIMWERDCGVVPIVDQDGHVMGMVTDRDICMAAMFANEPISQIAIGNVMSRDVTTCEASENIEEAERRMRERQVRRLPVIQDGETLVGILSLSDVVQALNAQGKRRDGRDVQTMVETVTRITQPRVDMAARSSEPIGGRIG
jgi:CBS domain-containing protein